MRRFAAVLLLSFVLIGCGADVDTVDTRSAPVSAASEVGRGGELSAWPMPVSPPALAFVVDGWRKDREAWWFGVEAAKPKPPQSHQTRQDHSGSTPSGRGNGSGGESIGGRCGGDLPPCGVMYCESGGSLTAVNRHNPDRPAGKWQIITSTWGGYGGYATADAAPESVQDARAREIYNGGRGRGQWAC